MILDAANAVIENNTGRKPKKLWTKNPVGAAITYYNATDERDEARFVVEQAQMLIRSGRYSYGDMAVLYRVNTQSRVFEEMLIKSGISYSMVPRLISCLGACSPILREVAIFTIWPHISSTCYSISLALSSRLVAFVLIVANSIRLKIR